MPNVGQFLALFEAVSRRDWKAVREVGESVAEEERKKKHYTAAHRLLEAIEVATSKSGFDLVGNIASEQSTLNSAPPDLLHYETLENVEEPILNSSIKNNLSDFLSEWKSEKKLVEIGLRPRQTILLYGPPGCGKTHLAKYISRALEMRLFTVRFDTLISSFLGETGSNIRKIFEFASHNRCVLFIDEIDAIAKLRDDKNELGELKRIVISLLQNLDLAKTKSLLITATNHPHMLDPALWRRFQIVWEITPPTAAARKMLLEKYLDQPIPEKINDLLQKVGEGLTGADFFAISHSTLRRKVLSSDTNLSEALMIAFIEHLRRHSGIGIQDQNQDKLLKLSLELKSQFGRKYSYHDLETISGIPHSTIHSKVNSSIKGRP